MLMKMKKCSVESVMILLRLLTNKASDFTASLNSPFTKRIMVTSELKHIVYTA
jgi:hypothetical protein